jgi:PPOX class probable F420-dependent enzyme
LEETTVSIVPDEYQDLLADKTRAFAYLATLMADGTPQVTPIWFNTDGTHILINSATGRIKDRNMRARPQVALVIADPKNPYRYVQVRGRIVEFTQEGADAHIDALAGKYTGEAKYQNHRTGEYRVIYKILPNKKQAGD